MYLIRGEWPHYRFSWPYLGYTRGMGHCDVEVFADVQPRPTIVLQEAPSNRSTSLTNSMEWVCTSLYKVFFDGWDLDPQRVRWLQRRRDLDGETEWSEVTLQFQNGAYANPYWKLIEEPQIVRAVAEPSPYWRETRQILSPQDFDPENFTFAPGECHKVSTGQCSLSPEAMPDRNHGEEGYMYCRGLATYAHAWTVARDYFGDDIPEERPEDMGWHDYLTQQWDSPYGTVPDTHNAWFGISLFAAINAHGLDGARQDDGLVLLNDGCHRACVASKLGISVAVVVADETNP